MTVGLWLKAAEAKLTSGGIWGARLDSQLILAFVLNKPKEWILAHPEAELVQAELQKLEDLVNRRLNHEPVVHLTGSKEFYGLEFEITPDVLTPRAETEPMVEWAVKLLPKGSRVVDMGTGSGALIIALGKHRPDLELVATDVSAEALAIAKRNAQRYNLNISFVQSDIWNEVDGKFDAILTNLPYLKNDAELTEEVKKEPAVALFGGDDGLDLYRRMLRGTPDNLADGGYLFTECDPWQQDSLKSEAGNYGFVQIEESYFVLGFQIKERSS
jgi:release factor glutamine methyltransferase